MIDILIVEIYGEETKIISLCVLQKKSVYVYLSIYLKYKVTKTWTKAHMFSYI